MTNLTKTNCLPLLDCEEEVRNVQSNNTATPSEQHPVYIMILANSHLIWMFRESVEKILNIQQQIILPERLFNFLLSATQENP